MQLPSRLKAPTSCLTRKAATGGIVWEARALTTRAALSLVMTGAEGGDRYTPPLLQMGTTGPISSVAGRGPTKDRST